MRARDARGATTVEFVILLPMLLLLAAAVIGAGRAWLAHAAVQQLADASARAASVSRTAEAARASAQQVVRDDSESIGVNCIGGAQVDIDTAGFLIPVGQAATVTTHVRCAVPVADLLIPGIGGQIDSDATAVSTLDRYRARS